MRALLLMIAPAACASVGALVMARHGAPRAMIALHLGALAAGTIVSGMIAARGRDALERRAPWMAGAALACLAATLVSPGLDGVHRWIGLGPVRLHPSSIVSPLLLCAAAAFVARGRLVLGVGVLLAAQAIHLVEPDAGQATALAAGGVIIAVSCVRSARARAVSALALVGAVAATWIRRDPLPAVPTVEGIMGLAGELGTAVHVAAIVLLGIVPLALGAAARGAPVEDGFAQAASRAITAYVAATILVPLAGSFPVPVMGFGVSPVIGVAISAGVVAALTIDVGDRA